MARYSFIVCAVLALAAAPPVQAETREKAPPTWRGIDGQVLGSGTLSAITADAIHIQKLDASTTTFKLESLSIADRALALTNKYRQSEFQKAIRQWTSAGENYRVEAKVLSVDGTTARLVKADGKVASVPLDKLSKDDRAYLDRLQLAGKLAEQERDPFALGIEPFGSMDSFVGNPPPSAETRPKTASTAPIAVPGTGSKALDEQTVYVTSSGTTYHTAGCRYLNKSSIPMPLNEAASRYSPCTVCHPPTATKNGDASKTAHVQGTTAIPATQPSSDFVDRNPNDESSTGQTATGIPTFAGPRGGQYHYSKSGEKVYEKKK